MNETARYLKRASLTWELLRVIYNAVLLWGALACPAQQRQFIARHFGFGYWGYTVLLIAVANAFYCLGPLLDIYACTILGFRLGPDRYLLFATGLVFCIAYVARAW